MMRFVEILNRQAQGLWLRALSVGGHSGVSGDLINLKKHTNAEQNAKRRNKNSMRNLTNVSENNNVVNCEDSRYSSISQFPTVFLVGQLASKYQVLRLLGQTS
eukprot:835039-Pleurochrysis_carterae.AAC.2